LAWVLALGLGIGAVVGLQDWSSADAVGTIASIVLAMGGPDDTTS
jgi:hypothetical protein